MPIGMRLLVKNIKYRLGIMYKVKEYDSAPNLWCVYEEESGIVIYANIYKCECELKALEYNKGLALC